MIVNNENISVINFNGNEVSVLRYNGEIVWQSGIPNNEIWYETSNGAVAQTTQATGLTSLETMGLVSNTYEDGKGVVKFSKDVTEIGQYAFYNCKTITSIEMPDCVETIGRYVFARCSGLSEIKLPENITIIDNGVFTYCSGLTSVDIPVLVKSIGSTAFFQCTGLKEIVFPDGITTIGNNAFAGCTSLTSATFPDSVSTISTTAFDMVPEVGELHCSKKWFDGLSSTSKTNLGNVANWKKDWEEGAPIVMLTLTDGSTRIDSYSDGIIPANTYSGDTTIASVSMDEGITKIGGWCFKGCTNLSSVELSPNLSSLGEWSFEGTSSLRNISLPDSLTEVKDGAFHSSGIETVEFNGYGLDYIPRALFSYCRNLDNVTIPSSVKILKEEVFAHCSILSTINLSNIEQIWTECFSACYGLTSVTLPQTLSFVGDRGFIGCQNLQRASLGGCRTLYINAFKDCTSLNYVAMPDSLSMVETDVFMNVPASGSLDCSKVFYDNMSTTNKNNLGNVARWKKNWTPCVVVTMSDGNKREYGFPDGIIPDDISLFQGNTGIVSAECQGITNIGRKAFYNCSNLSAMTFDEGLKVIGNDSMHKVGQISKLVLPSTLEKIDLWAFSESAYLIRQGEIILNMPTARAMQIWLGEGAFWTKTFTIKTTNGIVTFDYYQSRMTNRFVNPVPSAV